MINVKETHS